MVRKFLTLQFLLPQLPVIVALLGIAWLNWTYSHSLSATREAVAHSLRVNGAISAVLSQVQDIEVGQRGYLLTRDSVYLEPYDRSRAALGQTLADLRRLVADNLVQTALLGQMEPVLHDKLVEIDATLRLSQAGFQAEAVAEVKSNRGKTMMDALRDMVEVMRQDEAALLEARTTAMHQIEGRALLMVLIGLGLTIAGRIISGMMGAAAKASRAE